MAKVSYINVRRDRSTFTMTDTWPAQCVAITTTELITNDAGVALVAPKPKRKRKTKLT